MSDALLLTVSLALTAFGLFASWGAAKRRGTASGLRGAAWSLVPLGFYLTGLTEFLSDLVFSPVKWAGVVTLGLAGVLYVVSGVKLRAPKQPEQPGRPKQTRSAARPAVSGPSPAPGAPVDDLSDIEEILRRRGIS